MTETDYPPVGFVRQLAIHSPLALWPYELLWLNQDERHRLNLHKDTAQKHYAMTYRELRQHVFALARNGLCEILDATDLSMCIELVQWGPLFEEAS